MKTRKIAAVATAFALSALLATTAFGASKKLKVKNVTAKYNGKTVNLSINATGSVTSATIEIGTKKSMSSPTIKLDGKPSSWKAVFEGYNRAKATGVNSTAIIKAAYVRNGKWPGTGLTTWNGSAKGAKKATLQTSFNNEKSSMAAVVVADKAFSDKKTWYIRITPYNGRKKGTSKTVKMKSSLVIHKY